MTASERTKTKSLLLRARLWLGKRWFGSLGPSVVRVSKCRVIKGPCESVELEGLRYVARHTSIPVPKVHRTHRVDGRLYIEMEYVRGNTLQAVWSRDILSTDEKRIIAKQVADYIDQLRVLEPPRGGVVASAELGPCLDYRVGYDLFGPFTGNEEFHSFLRGSIPLEDCTRVYGEAVTRCHRSQYRTCFSHGDLCPRNLIIRKCEIVAVIDWQFAGWYPEYWEYTKAHFGLLNMPDWYVAFEHAVPRYDDELEAERALWRQLDQPGMLSSWNSQVTGLAKQET